MQERMRRIGAQQAPLDMKNAVSGVLVIDKPENISSAGVINRLKKIPGILKTGHTGTLDPFATGVLVCVVNQATRLSEFFSRSKKKYRATLMLGAETDTQDLTGTIVRTASIQHISEADVLAAAKSFEGEIQQVPPTFSALKHKGVPLYAYARKGTPVIKPARTVCIDNIRITAVNLPEIFLEVTCTSGTYIRTLCADMGKTLGCGGFLKALRRIESGGFSIDEALPLKAVEDLVSMKTLEKIMVPMSESLRNIKGYIVTDPVIEKIRYGKTLAAEDIGSPTNTERDPWIKLMDPHGKLLAVVERADIRGVYNYCCVFIK